jgi:hypothetical protein
MSHIFSVKHMQHGTARLESFSGIEFMMICDGSVAVENPACTRVVLLMMDVYRLAVQVSNF